VVLAGKIMEMLFDGSVDAMAVPEVHKIKNSRTGLSILFIQLSGIKRRIQISSHY
jgi:hypothetical protein